VLVQYVLPCLEEFNVNSDDFRRQKLYLEVMDRMFTAQKRRLRKVFNYFRCQHIGPCNNAALMLLCSRAVLAALFSSWSG
jgi:hypothetical protein